MGTIKKKRKSVKRPNSGRYISQEQYEALFNSYLEKGSIREAADEAGVSLETAKKYVNEGTAQYPAIKQRVTDINHKTADAVDSFIAEKKASATYVLGDMVDQLASAIKEYKFIPANRVLRNEDGEPILDETTGKPILIYDEKTFTSMVNNFEKLIGIIERIEGNKSNPTGSQSGSGPSIGSININATQDSVEDFWRSIAKSAGDKDSAAVLVKLAAAEKANRKEVIDVEPNES